MTTRQTLLIFGLILAIAAGIGIGAAHDHGHDHHGGAPCAICVVAVASLIAIAVAVFVGAPDDTVLVRIVDRIDAPRPRYLARIRAERAPPSL